jgi:epoxide hydrolase 4
MPERHANSGIRHDRIAAAGVELHVAAAGHGPPVILLHGFPANWRSWAHQIPALVAAGFHVLVPDLRGYHESDRPVARDAYLLKYLVADVAALVRSTGYPRAHIVGHDWGGIVAWTFAGEHRELVEKLAIVNAPHLEIYLKEVKRPAQMFRSWYVLFFRVPRLPERVLSASNYAVVRRMFRPASAFTDEEIDSYIRGLQQPGALTAALNYYRANAASLDALYLARSARVSAETLVIWGEQDPALARGLLDGLEHVAPRVRVHRIPGAGHWVQHEAADQVSRALVAFFAR